MLRTHYIKTSPADRKFPSPLTSLVHGYLKDDELFTEKGAIDYIVELHKYRPSYFADAGCRVDRINIKGAFDILVREKFVKEIYGMRLDKFVNSLS